jgi:hypothetical protein
MSGWLLFFSSDIWYPMSGWLLFFSLWYMISHEWVIVIFFPLIYDIIYQRKKITITHSWDIINQRKKK